MTGDYLGCFETLATEIIEEQRGLQAVGSLKLSHAICRRPLVVSHCSSLLPDTVLTLKVT